MSVPAEMSAYSRSRRGAFFALLIAVLAWGSAGVLLLPSEGGAVVFSAAFSVLRTAVTLLCALVSALAFAFFARGIRRTGVKNRGAVAKALLFGLGLRLVLTLACALLGLLLLKLACGDMGKAQRLTDTLAGLLSVLADAWFVLVGARAAVFGKTVFRVKPEQLGELCLVGACAFLFNGLWPALGKEAAVFLCQGVTGSLLLFLQWVLACYRIEGENIR